MLNLLVFLFCFVPLCILFKLRDQTMIFPFYAFWTPAGFVRWTWFRYYDYHHITGIRYHYYLAPVSYSLPLPTIIQRERDLKRLEYYRKKLLESWMPNESLQHFLSIRYPTEQPTFTPETSLTPETHPLWGFLLSLLRRVRSSYRIAIKRPPKRLFDATSYPPLYDSLTLPQIAGESILGASTGL